MAIGVSYDDFWHADPELVRYAIECDRITSRNKVISEDLLAWNTGRYVMLAVGVVLSQAFGGNRGSQVKYPAEPIIGPELDAQLAEAKRERELVQARDSFLALAHAMASKLPNQEYAEPIGENA